MQIMIFVSLFLRCAAENNFLFHGGHKFHFWFRFSRFLKISLLLIHYVLKCIYFPIWVCVFVAHQHINPFLIP